MPGVSVIDGDMNNGSDAVAFFAGDAELFHQFQIPCGHRVSVYSGGESVTADFLDIRYAAPVNFLSVSSL